MNRMKLTDDKQLVRDINRILDYIYSKLDALEARITTAPKGTKSSSDSYGEVGSVRTVTRDNKTHLEIKSQDGWYESDSSSPTGFKKR